jgi:polar amino acid transport system substrate-binding protein
MNRKISLLLMLTLLLSLVIAGCGSGSEPAAEDTSLADIKAKGFFIMGLDDAFPPMGFRGESGEIEGFDVDMANEVASRMGVKAQLQPIDWTAKEMEINNKNIDVIWNGFTITPEREKAFTFSQPYLGNKQVIVVLSDAGIDTKADLSGKKVGVQLDSSGQAAVEKDTATLDTFDEFLKFDTYTTALMDLKNGTLDAVVGDEILIKYMMTKDPGTFKIATENFGDELYGVGFRKADVSFAEEVNRVLNEMIVDGTAADISTKWFGEDMVYVPIK